MPCDYLFWDFFQRNRFKCKYWLKIVNMCAWISCLFLFFVVCYLWIPKQYWIHLKIKDSQIRYYFKQWYVAICKLLYNHFPIFLPLQPPPPPNSSIPYPHPTPPPPQSPHTQFDLHLSVCLSVSPSLSFDDGNFDFMSASCENNPLIWIWFSCKVQVRNLRFTFCWMTKTKDCFVTHLTAADQVLSTLLVAFLPKYSRCWWHNVFTACCWGLFLLST